MLSSLPGALMMSLMESELTSARGGGADDDEAGPEASSVAIDIFCREASVGVSAAAIAIGV
jgi:hypothetical protein